MYKELIICVIIIAFIAIGDFITQNYIKKSVEELKLSMSKLEDNLKNSNKEEAEKETYEITDKINNFHKASAYYIEHDELEKVENNFTKCTSLTKTGNYDLAINELNATIFVLEHIADKYSFNLENIF